MVKSSDFPPGTKFFTDIWDEVPYVLLNGKYFSCYGGEQNEFGMSLLDFEEHKDPQEVSAEQFDEIVGTSLEEESDPNIVSGPDTHPQEVKPRMRVIRHGLAGPDDPIYREGLSMFPVRPLKEHGKASSENGSSKDKSDV